MKPNRRKYLRPRQRPERAVKVRPYDPDAAIGHLKTRLAFLALGFEYYGNTLAMGDPPSRDGATATESRR